VGMLFTPRFWLATWDRRKNGRLFPSPLPNSQLSCRGRLQGR
jgi:hypothetical protein